MQFDPSDDRNNTKALEFLTYKVSGLGLSVDFYMAADVSNQIVAYILRAVFSDYVWNARTKLFRKFNRTKPE